MDWQRGGSRQKSLKSVSAEGKRTYLHVSEALPKELAWIGGEAVVDKSLRDASAEGKRTHLHVSEAPPEELAWTGVEAVVDKSLGDI